MNSALAPVATRLYKVLLHLYPAAFRTDFGDEMVCDFEDATSDAWRQGGWAGMLAAWTILAADLLRTITIQWLRSGVPVIVATSAAWTVSCCILMAQQGVPVPRPDMSFLIPPKNADQELQLVVLASAVTVVLIVATVLITGCFWMSVVKRRSRA